MRILFFLFSLGCKVFFVKHFFVFIMGFILHSAYELVVAGAGKVWEMMANIGIEIWKVVIIGISVQDFAKFQYWDYQFLYHYYCLL